MYSKSRIFELKNTKFKIKHFFFIDLSKDLEVVNFRFLENFRFLTLCGINFKQVKIKTKTRNYTNPHPNLLSWQKVSRVTRIQTRMKRYVTGDAMTTNTVNDLFSAQCAKERLFLFNFLVGKSSPFSAPIMKHFPG